MCLASPSYVGICVIFNHFSKINLCLGVTPKYKQEMFVLLIVSKLCHEAIHSHNFKLIDVGAIHQLACRFSKVCILA